MAVAPDRGDRRVRRAHLTAAGEAEEAGEWLDRLSDVMVISMLESLDERRRARLVEAMDDVEQLLRASMITIASADPASADARWCMQQYFAELAARFDAGFDPAASIPTGELLPPTGCCWWRISASSRWDARRSNPGGLATGGEAHMGRARGPRPRAGTPAAGRARASRQARRCHHHSPGDQPGAGRGGGSAAPATGRWLRQLKAAAPHHWFKRL